MLVALAFLALPLVAPLGPQATPVQEAYIKASNTGPNDSFGRSISYSGNTLIVGATGEDSNATCVNGDQNNNSQADTGAAYVFVRSGSQWTQQAYLKPPGGTQLSCFGASVAIDGDLAAVAAQSGLDSVIHLFERMGTTWSCHSTIPLPLGTGFRSTARDLALTPDYLVLGLSGDASNATGINGDPNNSDAPDSGAAYVMVRNGTQWTQQAYLKASNAETGDRFGFSVAASGETVVVGAHGEASNGMGTQGDPSDNSVPFRGAVYIFTRSGSTWSQDVYLKPTTVMTSLFGGTVSLSGNTLAIAASQDYSAGSGVNPPATPGTVPGSGAAFIFTRTGTAWSEEAYIKSDLPGIGCFFGSSISVSGDFLIVAEEDNLHAGTGINANRSGNTLVLSGAAYGYSRTGTQWTQVAYIKSPSPGSHEQFGWGVASSGSSMVVSTHRESGSSTGINGDATNDDFGLSGACYAYDMLGTVPNTPVGTSLCNGDGGNQAGCVNCPCSNNASPGTVGGCLNSTGASARLAATGDASVSLHHGAYTDLRFALTETRPDSFCVLVSGNSLAPQNMANPCFGISFGVGSAAYDGLRCSVGSLLRHGGRRSDLAGDVGVTNNPWGGEFNPQAGLAQAQGGFVAGQARYFQAIYRDVPTMTCTRGLGTSQAIEIVFTP